MKIKSLATALLVPMLFACNSQADRQALKEELKAELQAEQTAKENERLKEERQRRPSSSLPGQGRSQSRQAEGGTSKTRIPRHPHQHEPHPRQDL